jgi:hypothetical protein
MTFLVAVAVAISVCILVGAAIAWTNAVSRKRLMRRLALCECAACGSAFALDVVLRERDRSA